MEDLSPGVYEHLVTNDWEHRLAAVAAHLVQRQGLNPAEAPDILARHVAELARRALRAVPTDDQLSRQVKLANEFISAIAQLAPAAIDQTDLVGSSRELLAAIVDRPMPPVVVAFPKRPQTPFSTGALLVNGRGQPRIGHEVAAEMASANEVDLLCAFIKWQGVRMLEDAIREFTTRGGRFRVITTTYLGATDQRALDRLARLGATIKVSYETASTRLHAKAWLFRRTAGTTTAYVGSSNMSRAALVDGLEWNVRISALEQPYVIDVFEGTFNEYWDDTSFEDYDPDADRERLRKALVTASGGQRTPDAAIELSGLDVNPYAFQQEILEQLAAQREVHDNWRNLVVMATGTGKTVVAALDYRRLRQAKRIESLLFVAHQEQILSQSRSVFRHVLRDGTFGELFVDGSRPTAWQHVFASVQSLHRLDLDELPPSIFDMVIVDEFHHAEAPTYTRVLDHLQPRLLLGLTATPERADGQDIRRWFDGHTSVELRLWEALERQLLAPFHYFGIHDDVDLSGLHWKRGQGYAPNELSNVYTGHEARARIILQAVRDKIDPSRMHAIGFCVSIDHANFMAARFNSAGVAAAAIISTSNAADRATALAAFRNGHLRILFTVDLFNEGVDLPLVDTILLLRPTQSATIFLQQLGRGLRRADGKACLVVLDFIGAQHAQFRFDLRYRALTGATRRGLARDVEQDFPTLPAGCHIQLDRVAKQVVLDNLRRSITIRRRELATELRHLDHTTTLADFLAETGIELEDLYRNASHGGWAGLRRDAGLDPSPAGPHDQELTKAIARILHVDDQGRLAHLRRIADGQPLAPNREATMLHLNMWGTEPGEFPKRLRRLQGDPARCDELRQVIDVLHARIHRVTRPLSVATSIPLSVHARYRRDEACAAFGITNPGAVREGVRWVKDENADIFFVTLVKTEKHYSPTTMYADRAVSPTHFQWESQNSTRANSPTGQRYIHHAARGSTVHLFLRETKETNGDLGAPPYLYVGTMRYLSHTGERPMRIQWHLDHPLPADVYHAARVAAG